MILRADKNDTDSSIEGLCLEIFSQTAKFPSAASISFPAPEAKLLVAMRLNLEIMKMNRLIGSSPGVEDGNMDGHVRR